MVQVMRRGRGGDGLLSPAPNTLVSRRNGAKASVLWSQVSVHNGDVEYCEVSLSKRSHGPLYCRIGVACLTSV